MSRDRWDALVRGEACAVCAESRVQVRTTARAISWRTCASAACGCNASSMCQAGAFCCSVARRHVREPHELPETERIAFFEDMVRVGRVLEGVYAALKMNMRFWGITCRICTRIFSRATTAIHTRVEQAIQHQASRRQR